MRAELRALAAHLPAPAALIDRDALDRNTEAIAARAQGAPVRVASKSLRVRAALDRILEHPGMRGVLAFTLPEALWLARRGHDDLVVGYPTADRAALRALADDARARRAIAIMVDDPAQLDLIPVTNRRRPVRVCLDVDVSYLGVPGLRFGTRRSPIRTPEQAAAAARTIAARPGVELVGVMAYESQIAGIPDGARTARGGAIRMLRAASIAELAARRAAIVAAVREAAPNLEFVNGGGTGSIESTVAEPAVTEVAAGSGFFSPVLFDGYRGFRHEPAAFFGLDVVRKPDDATVTVLGGGWTASGPAAPDRLPTPVHPPGLRYRAAEGAGEVQTPLSGPAARGLVVGDRVWFRHAKAGELAERVSGFAVAAGGSIVERWPSYRGEGHAFL
ncbi:MAG: amino acid deaminase/aldolase [Microbacteriaceae bacterium]|nr:amino acid deaminase/aldolase [Microbacteriaceae bacterium]